jgi:uncharacterized SAM-binding protein YcdF (DUF218 family)
MTDTILIVLGGPITSDFKPDIWLKSRLDKTVEINKSLNPKYIILTGGDTRKIGITEAEIMKDYLLDNDISRSKIYLETNSINTIENGKFTYEMIKHLPKSTKIYVLTSEFHSNRSKYIFENFFVNYSINMIEANTPISKIELDALKRNDIKLLEKTKKYFNN